MRGSPVTVVGYGTALGAMCAFVFPDTAGTLYLVVASMLVVVSATRIRSFRPEDRPPWRTLAIGVSLLIVSGVARTVDGVLSETVEPFPSIADIPGALGYVGIIATMRLFISAHGHRHPRWRREAAIDGVIVGAAVAVVIFASILGTYVNDPAIAIEARTTNVVYSILTIILVGHIATLAVGSGVRNETWRLLAGATSLIVVSDLLLLLDTAGTSWARRPAGAVAILAFGGGLAAVVHPDAMRMGDTAAIAKPALSIGRVAMLGSAMFIVPVTLAFSVLAGTEPDLAVVTAGAVSLSGLALYRFWLLFEASNRVADHESALREAAPALVSATDIGEALNVAQSAAVSILGDEAEVSQRRDGDPARHAMCLGTGDAFLDVVPHGELDDAQTIAIRGLDAQLRSAVQGIEARESEMRDRLSRRLNALVEQSADIVFVVDDDYRIIYASPNADRILGRRAANLVGSKAVQLCHAEDVSAMLASVDGVAQPIARAYEVRIATGENEYRWFDVMSRDFGHDPEVAGIVVTARDVNEERAAKIGLRRSEEWFRGLVQNSADVIAVLDEAGIFTYVSPAAEHLTGLRPDELRGRSFLEIVSSDSERERGRLRSVMLGAANAENTFELQIARADGGERSAEVTVTDLRDDPSVHGLVLNIRDITERKRLEEDLRHQVLHDDLTGLGSRVQFTNQLAAALSSPREPGQRVAALFIDLDDFKHINDSLGHAAGDQVLVEISSRLLGRLRLKDRAARFGGDEFAVLLTDVFGESDVANVADRVVEELSRPVMLMGQEVRLGVSVGVALDDEATQTPEDLLRAADVAMYEAKAQGKGRWAIFESQMADETLERFEISNSLAAAIENDELTVHYQPILDLLSGKTAGVEALVRWNHPDRGMVSPASFIPLAERNGLIVPLGRKVLTTALDQVASWRSAGHDIYASVNISPVQLLRDGIVTEVLEIVDASGINRDAVVLELTESALINDFELVVSRIDALRAAGLRVAIDDFGTGYATLKYADEFSADILKIDQSFVSRLETQDDSTIVSTVLTIASGMGAETVAEGIEVPDQHKRLLALGCRLGQGYYFARPAPADVIGALLDRELDGEALAGHAH